MVSRVPALAAMLALCTGCDLITESFATNDFSGDPFPIHVDTRSGAVMFGLRAQGVDHAAVLDVLSPLTLIDPGPQVKATIGTEDVTLLGDREGFPGDPVVPRARLDAQQVLRLHPCASEAPFCRVGVVGRTEVELSAIVGADALAGDALRMRLGEDRVFVLADIGGTNADRTRACDAVFPQPFRGGGTLVVADTEVPFAGRRITMQACLDPDPLAPVQVNRGADTLFAMSSSIGPSLLSESAYERYRHSQLTSTPLSLLPEAEVLLPSGPVRGRLATIRSIALVARASSDPLAPCRQVYAHAFLLGGDCLRINDTEDCPCEDNNDQFCSVPANVHVEPAAGIELLVVPDDTPTLQALRTEFRPSLQEIDGILGTGVLRDLELDVDYPHNRVLARCTTPSCDTRPALEDEDDRQRISTCLAMEP